MKFVTKKLHALIDYPVALALIEEVKDTEIAQPNFI